MKLQTWTFAATTLLLQLQKRDGVFPRQNQLHSGKTGYCCCSDRYLQLPKSESRGFDTAGRVCRCKFATRFVAAKTRATFIAARLILSLRAEKSVYAAVNTHFAARTLCRCNSGTEAATSNERSAGLLYKVCCVHLPRSGRLIATGIHLMWQDDTLKPTEPESEPESSLSRQNCTRRIVQWCAVEHTRLNANCSEREECAHAYT